MVTQASGFFIYPTSRLGVGMGIQVRRRFLHFHFLLLLKFLAHRLDLNIDTNFLLEKFERGEI